jgi:uncharacterized protein YoxC
MIKALDHTRRLVALEAYNVQDLQGLIRRVFPSIESGISGFKGMFRTEPAVGLTSNQKEFSRKIEKRSFPSLMPVTAFVPEGLIVPYMQYAQALFPAVEHAAKAPGVINEFAIYLAQLVSNKSSIHETLSNKTVYTTLATTREAVNKAVGDCFQPGLTRTDVKVEDVIGRNAEWNDVFKSIGELSKLINSVERTHLQKKVEECSDYLERIRKQIDQGHYDKVAPEVIMNLADGAYQVGAELEFYSVMYYRVEAFSKSVDRTLQHVQKVVTPE